MCKRVLCLMLVLGLAGSASAALIASYDLDSQMMGVTPNAGSATANGSLVRNAALVTDDGSLAAASSVYNGTAQAGGKVLNLPQIGSGAGEGNADYVNCGNDVSLDISGNLTLMAWIKGDINAQPNNYWLGMIHKGDTGYRLTKQNYGPEGYVRFGARWYADPNGANKVNSTYDPMVDSAWHHYAGVYDGAKLKLYVDGILNVEADHNTGVNVTTWRLWIGACDEKKDWNNGRQFAGMIDEVKLLDEALDAVAIRELSGVPEPATIALLGLGGALLIRKKR